MSIILTKEILNELNKFRALNRTVTDIGPQIYKNKCMNCGKEFKHYLENVPLCFDCKVLMIFKCGDCKYVKEDMDCKDQCLDELSEKVC